MRKCESMLFYKEAVAYYRSATILKYSPEKENDDNYLFGPISYLTRHALELIFKAMIIKLLEEKNRDWLSIKFCIQIKNKQRKVSLTSIHSLKSLIEILVDYGYKFNVSDYGYDDIIQMVTNVDEYDEDSTFFRYPMDKKRNINNDSIEEAEDLLAYMHAPCCIGAVLSQDSYYKNLNVNTNIVDMDYDLYNILKSLIEDYH